MNKKEKEILRKVYENESGLLSPSLLLNSFAQRDFRSAENLITKGYLYRVQETKPGIPYPINFFALTERGLVEFAPFPSRIWYKVRENVTLLVAIASILFGMFSSFASMVTINAYFDAKHIASLAPKIEFGAHLNEQHSVDDKTVPRYFSIKNIGPVAASQLRVDFIAHEYDPTVDEISFSMNADDEGQSFIIGQLNPLEGEVETIDGNSLLTFMNDEVHIRNNSIIEARIEYRKDSDMQLYVYRAFYFLNPNGMWVNEGDASIDNSHYENMRNALVKFTRDSLHHSDILHDAM